MERLRLHSNCFSQSAFSACFNGVSRQHWELCLPICFWHKVLLSLCLVNHIFIPSRCVAGVVSHLLGFSTFKPDTRSQSLLFTKYLILFLCFAKIAVHSVYNRLRSRYSRKGSLYALQQTTKITFKYLSKVIRFNVSLRQNYLCQA